MVRVTTQRGHGPRLVGALAAGVLLASIGTACSTGQAAAPNTTVSYWSMWKENEPQAQVFKEAIAGFERETGIRVNVQWQGRQVMSKIAPTLRGNDVPDLVDQDEGLVTATVVAPGASRDLTGAYAREVQNGLKVSDIVPKKYADNLRIDGKPYMVPYEILGFGYWFNGARLPNVVADPPKTWDSFVQLLDERKKGGAAPLALDADITDYNSFWTSSIIQNSLGRGVLHRIAEDHTGQAWKDPALRPALDKVEQLVRGGYFIRGYNGSKWPTVQEKWSQNAADLLLLGSWTPSETGKSAAPGFQYRFFAPPSAGAQQNMPVRAIGWVLPAKARNPDAAEKFMAYFLRDENLSKIASVAKNLTPNPKLPVPPELADLGRQSKELAVSRLDDGVDADFPGYATEAFYPVNDKLIKGQIGVDEFVDQMAQAQANYWKKNG